MTILLISNQNTWKNKDNISKNKSQEIETKPIHY